MCVALHVDSDCLLKVSECSVMIQLTEHSESWRRVVHSGSVVFRRQATVGAANGVTCGNTFSNAYSCTGVFVACYRHTTVLRSVCMCSVFCVDLRTNSDYFPIQH
jgi:hypothetical protein